MQSYFHIGKNDLRKGSNVIAKRAPFKAERKQVCRSWLILGKVEYLGSKLN